MDAFYASVEQHDNPEYRNKPIAVGGGRERGVVAAASYEARKYGVRSAMPSVTAAKKCPQLIFVPPRFDRYKEISSSIHQIFASYTDLIEPLSLDEAFLDVSENKKGIQSATVIAELIKKEIKETTGLTASAGISNSKFLAKIASDYQKPDGLFLIHPDKAELFVEQLEIEKFFGIGKVTAEKMHKMGIQFGRDLKKFNLNDLQRHFGKAGTFYFNIARGIDYREVQPDRKRKSIGAENTFTKDLILFEELQEELEYISTILERRIRKAESGGRTITVKVKFSDFTTISRSKTFTTFLSTKQDLLKHSTAILRASYNPSWKVRLLGISVKNLESELEDGIQLTLDF